MKSIRTIHTNEDLRLVFIGLVEEGFLLWNLSNPDRPLIESYDECPDSFVILKKDWIFNNPVVHKSEVYKNSSSFIMYQTNFCCINAFLPKRVNGERLKTGEISFNEKWLNFSSASESRCPSDVKVSFEEISSSYFLGKNVLIMGSKYRVTKNALRKLSISDGIKRAPFEYMDEILF